MNELFRDAAAFTAIGNAKVAFQPIRLPQKNIIHTDGAIAQMNTILAVELHETCSLRNTIGILPTV